MTRNEAERIRQALPPLEAYIDADLKKTGGELRGAHPVHGSDTGNNFAVNPGKQNWYCFRHNEGGGIFEYIAIEEGLVECGESIADSFPEVLEIAAEEAGLEYSPSPKNRKKLRERRKERELLDTIYEKAMEFYKNNLTEEKRQWLKEKYGLEKTTLEKAGVGYAPVGDESLVKHLETKGHAIKDMKRTGLVVDTKYGPKDFFQGRIVFPFFKHGNPRYFIGRKTSETPDVDWEQGKYRKLPLHDNREEVSPLVEEPLYGRDSIRGEDQVIVTEGVTDVLMLHQAGYAAISPVTTSFKKEKVEDVAQVLRNKTAVVVMDEDSETEAGLQGAIRTAKTLAKKNVDTYVGRLPVDDGESTDVAEFLRDNPRNAFEKVLDNVIDAYTASWRWSDGSPADLFAASLESIGLDPHRVRKIEQEDEPPQYLSVWEIVDEEVSLANAGRQFRRPSNPLPNGKDLRDMMIESVWRELQSNGQFFHTEGGIVYYFYTPEEKVYKVSGKGKATSTGITDNFKGLIEAETGLTEDRQGRTMFSAIARRARRRSPERDVYKFSAWNDEEEELYIYDFDNGYYALDGETVERRINGTDVFFVDMKGDAINYLEPEERDFPEEQIPGELDKWAGEGDPVNRLITNRVNYSPRAVLKPKQQRKQLYLHIHALPFLEYLDSRPILAFIGQKGSGKTVSMRNIGRFLFGKDWQESDFPNDQDDFSAIVVNRPLAFFDNYDDGVEWANDALARVATGAGIFRRQYYTTMDLAYYSPDCFLAITSRDPPFRRDDVADRTLVFRVKRFNEFLGTKAFLEPVERYRDDAWSTFIDNLNKVVAKLQETDLGQIRTGHRMADWAAFAKIAGNVLGLEDVDQLLDKMQKERAEFALEDDTLKTVVDSWLNDESNRGVEHSASSLLEELQGHAEFTGQEFTYESPQSLGKRLSNVRDELNVLFGFEVVEGHRNKYKFKELDDDDPRASDQQTNHSDNDDDDDDDDDSGGSGSQTEQVRTNKVEDLDFTEDPCDEEKESDSSDEEKEGDTDTPDISSQRQEDLNRIKTMLPTIYGEEHRCPECRQELGDAKTLRQHGMIEHVAPSNQFNNFKDWFMHWYERRYEEKHSKE